RGRAVQCFRSSTEGSSIDVFRVKLHKSASDMTEPDGIPDMLQTVPAFDRLGEENAFAVLARATELAHQGRDIINLGIGQPDFRTPEHIVEAAIKALRDGH